jgi:hypothetical protein
MLAKYWILIILQLYGNPMPHHVNFHTKAACEKALADLKSLSTVGNVPGLVAVCEPSDLSERMGYESDHFQ